MMTTTTEEQLYGFYQLPGSKNHWKENIFSNFWSQQMSLKREIFVNFLPQKFMTKCGIVSTYSVTIVSQKILACLQCHSVGPGIVESHGLEPDGIGWLVACQRGGFQVVVLTVVFVGIIVK